MSRPSNTPWPAAKLQLLRDLHASGVTRREAAARLGCTVQVVSNHSGKFGLIWKPAPRTAKPLPVAPDLVPLVEAALAADPAGAVRVKRCGSARAAAKSWPRHLAAYVASVELNYGARATARTFGCAGTLISYAVSRIEERRDEPAFDAFVSRLAEQARAIAA